MAYRTRRETRYMKLRNAGFLRFEARPLSKVPSKVCPYLRAMMEERRDWLRKEQKAGKTLKEYEAEIRELYRAKDWTKKNRVGKTVADPWKMLREFEDKWKDKQPQYTSPWQGRQKKWRDFQRMLEPTLKKQMGMA